METSAEPLSELLTISHAVGADPDLVQGGGGNTSVKDRAGRILWVKASGTSLGEMEADRGYVRLRLGEVRQLVRRSELAALPVAEREAEVLRHLSGTVEEPPAGRPSVESTLHALLGRVVIHSHPVGLGAALCCQRSEAECRALLADLQPAPLYVEYVDPGYTLGARLAAEIGGYGARHGVSPAVVLLANHGLVVAADEAAGCLALHQEIAQRGRRWSGADQVNPPSGAAPPPAPGAAPPGLTAESDLLEELRKALVGAGGRDLQVFADTTAIAAELLAGPGALAAAAAGAVTPDQVVYCRTRALVLDDGRCAAWGADVRRYAQRFGFLPRVFLIGRRAVAYAAGSAAQGKVVADVFRNALTALLRSARGGGPRLLDPERAGFIERWEAEHYRARLLEDRAED